jgi:hypothetical protein
MACPTITVQNHHSGNFDCPLKFKYTEIILINLVQGTIFYIYEKNVK